jgi:hypothetical protein
VQGPNPVVFANQGQIVSFAQRNRLPPMYPVREYVDAGGRMSYGPVRPICFGGPPRTLARSSKAPGPPNSPSSSPPNSSW